MATITAEQKTRLGSEGKYNQWKLVCLFIRFCFSFGALSFPLFRPVAPLLWGKEKLFLLRELNTSKKLPNLFTKIIKFGLLLCAFSLLLFFFRWSPLWVSHEFSLVSFWSALRSDFSGILSGVAKAQAHHRAAVKLVEKRQHRRAALWCCVYKVKVYRFSLAHRGEFSRKRDGEDVLTTVLRVTWTRLDAKPQSLSRVERN